MNSYVISHKEEVHFRKATAQPIRKPVDSGKVRCRQKGVRRDMAAARFKWANHFGLRRSGS
jgi:hypothetical protein